MLAKALAPAACFFHWSPSRHRPLSNSLFGGAVLLLARRAAEAGGGTHLGLAGGVFAGKPPLLETAFPFWGKSPRGGGLPGRGEGGKRGGGPFFFGVLFFLVLGGGKGFLGFFFFRFEVLDGRQPSPPELTVSGLRV